MANEWPLEGATVRLGRNVNGLKPKVGQFPFHVPPTISGTIKIGMENTIFIPDLVAQKTGFTPYMLEGDRAVDATTLLLAHYAGIYKRIKT